MQSEYYEWLGMLEYTYGEFENTDKILVTIEETISNLPRTYNYSIYGPIITILTYRQYVEEFTALPAISIMLNAIGIKPKRLLYHIKRLNESGLNPAQKISSFDDEVQKCCNLLANRFPLDENLVKNAQILLKHNHLWFGMRPMSVACCVYAILAIYGKLKYKPYDIAKEGKISASVVYNRLHSLKPYLIRIRPFNKIFEAEMYSTI
jgi:hypothetical protein